ncbi:hypothetical protein [Streptomyces sp. MUSC 14]|uniref:hypothetical protein n=1 Tax=Streptomyces sp. MUSC 14 TaxID=1354889 RepID=UPI000A4C3816|nr:hypothetical protein [Streptomyces sp. MUSC 14]
MAAALTGLPALALGFALPRGAATARDRCPTLLADTLRLLRHEPLPRRSLYVQVTVFGAFSAAWTAVALLALIDAASMFLAPAAGRRVDRYGPDRVNPWCVLLALASGAVLLTGLAGGPAGIVGYMTCGFTDASVGSWLGTLSGRRTSRVASASTGPPKPGQSRKRPKGDGRRASHAVRPPCPW